MRRENGAARILPALLVMGIALLFGSSTRAQAAQATKTVVDGVFLEDVDLSGLDDEQLMDTIMNYVEELQQKQVKVSVGKESVKTTLAKLGLTAEVNEIYEQAMEAGNGTNLIKRFKAEKALEDSPLRLSLQTSVDPEAVTKFVKKCSKFDIAAKNATVSREYGSFQYTDEVVGRKVDLDATEAALNELLEDPVHNDIALKATVKKVSPKYTREIVEQCDSVIGKFSTSFASSNASRCANIANATKLLDGLVLYPGEELSVLDKILPFTQENGYEMAGSYQNGMVIDSLGGGVCQVSTTLYNAILYAEMQVTKRYEHSMAVAYVDPARDAAVSEGYKDLKFVNPTDTPIYISGSIQGKTVTFTIYGKAKPAGREIKLVSEVTATIQPGEDKVTKDPTKPETYFKVTQEAHIGRKASLYKVVLQDGKEISRDLVNNSSYAASPRYVVQGTMKVEEPTTDPEVPDDGEEDPSSEDPDVDSTEESEEE